MICTVETTARTSHDAKRAASTASRPSDAGRPWHVLKPAEEYIPNCRPSACMRRLSDSTPLGNAAGSAARFPFASRSGACLRASVKSVVARCEHNHAPAVVQCHQRVACQHKGSNSLSEAAGCAGDCRASTRADLLQPQRHQSLRSVQYSSLRNVAAEEKRSQRVRGRRRRLQQHHAPEIVPRIEAHRRCQAKTVVQAATPADERERERST